MPHLPLQDFDYQPWHQISDAAKDFVVRNAWLQCRWLLCGGTWAARCMRQAGRLS